MKPVHEKKLGDSCIVTNQSRVLSCLYSYFLLHYTLMIKENHYIIKSNSILTCKIYIYVSQLDFKDLSNHFWWESLPLQCSPSVGLACCRLTHCSTVMAQLTNWKWVKDVILSFCVPAAEWDLVIFSGALGRWCVSWIQNGCIHNSSFLWGLVKKPTTYGLDVESEAHKCFSVCTNHCRLETHTLKYFDFSAASQLFLRDLQLIMNSKPSAD